MLRPARSRVAFAAALLLLVTACGDARLDKLTLGIPRDSATTLIGDQPHIVASYLTAGKQWDVAFYARSSVDAKDSVPWRKMSPVIFINNRAVGWGWHWWAKEAAKQRIPMPK